MLDDFLRNQDIDIALLQEVTHSNFTFLRRYEAHTNVGTANRGTAILAKEGITLTNITRLPTGRGITAYFEGIRIINIYAPSGAGKRREREAFFNVDMISLLPSAPTEFVLAGDFNCVLLQTDSTGQGNLSKTLEKLVRGLSLQEACDSQQLRHKYTHYT
jgi:exonuclease III